MIQCSSEWWISEYLKCKFSGATPDLLNTGGGTQQLSRGFWSTGNFESHCFWIAKLSSIASFFFFFLILKHGGPFLQDVSPIFCWSLKVIVCRCVIKVPTMSNIIIPVSILIDRQYWGKWQDQVCVQWESEIFEINSCHRCRRDILLCQLVTACHYVIPNLGHILCNISCGRLRQLNTHLYLKKW